VGVAPGERHNGPTHAACGRDRQDICQQLRAQSVIAKRDGGDAELADQSSPSIGTVSAPTAELYHNGDVPASAGQVTSSGKEAGA
jgi:hypothetical protein